MVYIYRFGNVKPYRFNINVILTAGTKIDKFKVGIIDEMQWNYLNKFIN